MDNRTGTIVGYPTMVLLSYHVDNLLNLRQLLSVEKSTSKYG